MYAIRSYYGQRHCVLESRAGAAGGVLRAGLEVHRRGTRSVVPRGKDVELVLTPDLVVDRACFGFSYNFV